MIEYYPWSIKELNKSIELYKQGKLSILDIEIGGKCEYTCLYCDSPKTDPSSIKYKDVERIVNNTELNWIFICGLGEPLHQNNRRFLHKILDLCYNNNVKCSMFTNAFNLDDMILDYLENDTLFLMYKLDTLKPEKMQQIYNTIKSDKILLNLALLEKYQHDTNNMTNLAASIVPTKLNITEIPEIVKNCVENNIFPLIGQLEYAGSAIVNFKQLQLSDSELEDLKANLKNMLGEEYQIPICPSTVCGVLVNYNSKVVVDKSTGLSCSWFWLRNPEFIGLLDFKYDSNWELITQSIIDYRNLKISNIQELIKFHKPLPFGGCGGDIIYLLSTYLDIHQQFISTKHS